MSTAVLFCGFAILAGQVAAPPWIPQEAELIVGFERPGEPLISRLQDELAFALDLGEAYQGFLERIGGGTGLDRLVFAVLPLEGEERAVVGIAQGASVSDRLARRMPDTLTSALVDRETLLFGEPAVLNRVIDQKGASRLSALALPSEIDPGARVWGVITPSWHRFSSSADKLAAANVGGRSLSRSLLGIQSMSFSASAGSDVLFTMRTRAADEVDAIFLADGLRAFLKPFQRDSNDAVAVREALRWAFVSRNGALVELAVPLTAEALDRIRHNEASKRLLTWRLGPEQREQRQNIAEIVRALGLAEGGQVADVGAGEGFFTVRLAWLVGRQGRVYAVDIDEKALSDLSERVQAAPFDNVEVVLGQPDDPKLPRGSLDAVLIVNTYHEMAQHQRMLERAYEALKPGGRIVLVEPFSPERRSQPREEQEKKHQIAPELVEQDLLAAGFRLVSRNETLTEPNAEGGKDFLILAVKPLQKT